MFLCSHPQHAASYGTLGLRPGGNSRPGTSMGPAPLSSAGPREVACSPRRRGEDGAYRLLGRGPMRADGQWRLTPEAPLSRRQALAQSSTLTALAELDPLLSERAAAGMVVLGASIGFVLARRMVSPGNRGGLSYNFTLLGMIAGYLDPLAADHPQPTVCILAVSLCYVQQVLKPSLRAACPPDEAADRVLMCELALPLLAGSISLMGS